MSYARPRSSVWRCCVTGRRPGARDESLRLAAEARPLRAPIARQIHEAATCCRQGEPSCIDRNDHALRRGRRQPRHRRPRRLRQHLPIQPPQVAIERRIIGRPLQTQRRRRPRCPAGSGTPPGARTPSQGNRHRLGSDRGSPNHGSTLLSKRVMAQIRSSARVST